MTLDEIGLTIRNARNRQKLSQHALAELVGMSRSTISLIEQGSVAEIGIRKIIALCDVLGLELMAREKSRRPTLQQLLEEQKRG